MPSSVISDPSSPCPDAPRLAPAGLEGWIVQFDTQASEAGNRAALAFAAAVRASAWPEVGEVASTLASVFVQVDAHAVSDAEISQRLRRLVGTRNWATAALPEGRRKVWIPTVWGGSLAPQFDGAAALADLSRDEALRQLSECEVRVLTLGFAPGQPYLGQLPAAFDLPRQTALTPRVPPGAVVVALRQIVVFAIHAPTGWRHLGQSAVRLFDPDAPQPALLRPGDVVQFPHVPERDYDALCRDPLGGVRMEALS